MISFTVPGEPVAKGRARSFIRNGRIGHHTPEKTVTYESMVRMQADAAMARANCGWLTGPLALSFTAVFAIPRNWPKKRLAAHGVTPESVTKKPDLDNLAKILGDGMNGIVYSDDCQIAKINCCKVYGETPCVLVMIQEISA